MSFVADLLAVADDDEGIVLSVIADHASEGGWRMRYATCLLVPSVCAQMSWSAWSAQQNHEAEATVTGGPLPSRFCVSGEGWLVARQPLELDEARAWLTEAEEIAEGSHDGRLPAIGVLPELEVSLSVSSAVIRAMPKADAAVGSLLSGGDRPAEGVLWSSPRQPVALELPPAIDIEGASACWPSHDLAGIHLTPAYVDDRLQTPEGLFVGRLERRAWLAGLRGTREADHKMALLGWDSTRVDPAGLILQTEEFDDQGELIMSQRIALADLNLASVRDSSLCEVTLPSAGPKLRHSLSLYAPDGSLLDRSAPAPFVETISLSISADGGEPMETTVGTALSAPTLPERRVFDTQARDALTALRKVGAENRVLRDRAAGLQRIRELLEGARGELLVSDPFFGQDDTDWQLVETLAVPVRVLTRKLAAEPAPVPVGVLARIRPRASLMMHERAYVWSDGGFILGGSPSTVGGPPVSIMPMSPSDAEVQRAIFEGLWSSPLFRDVSRR